MDNSIPSIHSPYCTPLVQDDLCIPTEEDLEVKRKVPTIMDESYQSPTRIAALSELIKARAAIE